MKEDSCETVESESLVDDGESGGRVKVLMMEEQSALVRDYCMAPKSSWGSNVIHRRVLTTLSGHGMGRESREKHAERSREIAMRWQSRAEPMGAWLSVGRRDAHLRRKKGSRAVQNLARAVDRRAEGRRRGSYALDGRPVKRVFMRNRLGVAGEVSI